MAQVAYSLSRILPQGAHTGAIRVELGDRATPNLLFIPIEVRVVPDAAVTPSAVIWGAIDVGEEATETLSIRTRSGRHIDLLEVTRAPEFISADMEAGADLQSRLVHLRATLDRPGPHSGNLQFRLRLEGDDEPQFFHVPVTLSGRAAPAAENTSLSSTP